jgi:hypothetical protein
LIQTNLRDALIYKVGDLVNASYQKSAYYYPGMITFVNDNFTYRIVFDDNDVDDNVTIDCIESREIAE